ncbi:MAG TPA: hypothetical protein VGC36_18045, partial [Rhizomicrobium sp.]
ISRGHAVIPDLTATQSRITAHLDGSMTDILKLTDMQPLNYATRFGIDPDATAGKASVDLDFHVPMRRNLNVDDIGINVKAVVGGFGISLGKTARLSDGAVTFEIDNNRLRASGTTGLATSRLAIDWVEDFHPAGAVSSKIDVKGAMDQAAREMLGLGGLNDYLRGPVGVSGTLFGYRGQLKSADLNLDLTPAALAVDLVGIGKPAGFPASAHAVATFAPHSVIASERMTITGPSLQATMALTFDGAGTLTELDAPSVRAGAANDFAFNLKRGPAGLDVSLRGRSLDGTQIARRGSGTGTGPGKSSGGSRPGGKSDSTFAEPFHINAKLDRVALRGGVAIAPFSLDVTGVADRPATMTLVAKVGKTGTLSGSIAPAGNDRQLTLATTDMGTLARGLFGFNSMKGGKLDLRATLHGPAAAPAADDAAAND